LLTKLLSGHGFDSTGALAPLDVHALSAAWQTLRQKYPETFSFESAPEKNRAVEIRVF
jgi:hypothetical protein